MKTDIFKDLVPLANMSEDELDKLVSDIISECPHILDKVRLLKLIRRIEQFSVKIKHRL